MCTEGGPPPIFFFLFFANNYQARSVRVGPDPFFLAANNLQTKKMKYHEAARPHIFGSM